MIDAFTGVLMKEMLQKAESYLKVASEGIEKQDRIIVEEEECKEDISNTSNASIKVLIFQ